MTIVVAAVLVAWAGGTVWLYEASTSEAFFVFCGASGALGAFLIGAAFLSEWWACRKTGDPFATLPMTPAAERPPAPLRDKTPAVSGAARTAAREATDERDRPIGFDNACEHD